MIARLLLAAIGAGLLAGLLITPVQYARLIPLILHAEEYESGGAVHDHSAFNPLVTQAQAHTHAEGGADGADAHEVSATGRMLGTVLANLVTGTGFALVLLAASLATARPITRENGIRWGLAGFAVVTLAPALGLAPELPAMPAADLGLRQTWWIATVLLSAGGLYALALRKEPGIRLAGIVALILPHLFGAPQPADLASPVPATLGAEFAVASLATAAVFWVLLGRLSGEALARWGGRSPASGRVPA